MSEEKLRDCIPDTFIIKHQDLKAHVCEFIAKSYQIKRVSPTFFPSQQPQSLRDKDIRFLREHQENYFVTTKTNGIRYLLVMGRFTEFLVSKYSLVHREFAVLVNRRYDMFQAKTAAGDYFYDGAVFDGELVWQQTSQNVVRQCFMLFDIVMLENVSWLGKPFTEKYERLNEIFDTLGKDNITNPGDWVLQKAGELAQNHKIVCIGSEHCLLFKPKQFLTIEHVGSLLRKKVDHPIDGIIFTPNLPTLPLFKWKTSNTVDLLIMFSPSSQGELEGWQIRSYMLLDGALVDTVEKGVRVKGKLMPLVVVPNQYLLDVLDYYKAQKTSAAFIFESSCRQEKGVVVSEICLLRRDKSSPNSLHVIEQTVEAVLEEITEASLNQITCKHPVTEGH